MVYLRGLILPVKPRRILIVGPAWVGDMIMSQVIYSSLRRDHPDAQIDVLAPQATLSLVQRMPEVSRGILLKLGHGEFGFGYRRGLGRQLAENGYDQAIITQNSLKSAFVPFFADIPRRTGFLGEYRYYLLNDIKFLDKKRLPRMTDRFLALLDEPGRDLISPGLLIDKANLSRVITANDLAPGQPVVGFCPGAEFGDAKKWPEHHFIELGKALIARGKQVWIFGSPADVQTGSRIAAGIGEGCRNLAGKTSILDAIDLISATEHIVTNDSGLMHIAAAVGVPISAIYGSTSPGFTPPLTEHANIFRLDLPCSPCFKRECPLGHKNCLNQLMPAQVIEQLS